MKRITLPIIVLLNCFSLVVCAQQAKMMEQMKAMAKERDPEKSVVMMKQIISDNKLDTIKNAEMIDVLKGNVAMAYLRERNYDAFKKYVGSMKNKFNQTSFMNMAAATLVKDSIDTEMAEQLAKETLDLYLSYKDDPKARPASMPEADWKRFVSFAQYPYYDTYAMTLLANAENKLKTALQYQAKAFDDSPEEGMPSAVERYARLLEMNSQEDKAYDLLVAMAGKGRSTAAMDKQLKALYARKHGNSAGFDEYFGKLQKGVQATLMESLKEKMRNEDAPGFTLVDLNGKKVSLSDFRGKVVVLDFWATWCAPCIASFPAMQKAMENNPDVKFLFIATLEKEEGALSRVKKFIDKNKYPFHVLMDKPMAGKPGKYEVVTDYKPTGIPAKAVIDGKGKLRFLSMGFSSDAELINELEAMIELAKKSS